MSWSEWLDFDRAGVEQVPEAAGVYMMHASMKVMHIGGSANMRKSLAELLSDPCTSKAKRFHYMIAEAYVETKEGLLKDYADKHAGKMPSCMEK
jgi:hypothetical protein